MSIGIVEVFVACIICVVGGIVLGYILERTRRPDGVIEWSEMDTKIKYNLIYFDPIYELPNKKIVVFKVRSKNTDYDETK